MRSLLFCRYVSIRISHIGDSVRWKSHGTTIFKSISIILVVRSSPAPSLVPKASPSNGGSGKSKLTYSKLPYVAPADLFERVEHFESYTVLTVEVSLWGGGFSDSQKTFRLAPADLCLQPLCKTWTNPNITWPACINLSRPVWSVGHLMSCNLTRPQLGISHGRLVLWQLPYEVSIEDLETQTAVRRIGQSSLWYYYAWLAQMLSLVRFANPQLWLFQRRVINDLIAMYLELFLCLHRRGGRHLPSQQRWCRWNMDPINFCAVRLSSQ